MNRLEQKGLLALAILTLAVFASMFATMSHAANLGTSSVHVTAGDSDVGAPCTGTGASQVGECTTGDGGQSGDQSTQDNPTEPVETDG
jgi:predicted S18 family serine protease